MNANNNQVVVARALSALDQARIDMAALLRLYQHEAKANAHAHASPTPYQEWCSSLVKGDRVRVCSPWDDGETPGGHISIGRVYDRRVGGVYVRFKNKAGRMRDEFFYFTTGHSGPYGYLMPFGRNVEYDPDRGMVFSKKGRRNKINSTERRSK